MRAFKLHSMNQWWSSHSCGSCPAAPAGAWRQRAVARSRNQSAQGPFSLHSMFISLESSALRKCRGAVLRQQATGAALRRLCCLVKSLYNVVIIVEWCSCSFGVTTRYSVRKGCKHAALTSELNQWGSLRGFVSHPSWPTCSCVGGWRNSLHPRNLRACLKVWPGLALRREVFQPALSSALEGTWPLVGGSLWPSHADSASQLFIFFAELGWSH